MLTKKFNRYTYFLEIRIELTYIYMQSSLCQFCK